MGFRPTERIYNMCNFDIFIVYNYSCPDIEILEVFCRKRNAKKYLRNMKKKYYKLFIRKVNVIFDFE